MIMTKQDRDERAHAIKARRCRCDHCRRWLKLYGRFIAVRRLAAKRKRKASHA
jgi:hypothetical protein